jgi:type II secretory pathway component PulM
MILGAGTLFVFIALVYLALVPSLERSTELQERYRVLQADLQWLTEQTTSVSRLSNSCVDKTIQGGDKTDVISRLVRRNQIKLAKIAEQTQGTYLLSLESPSGNRLLQLAYQLACQGLTINILDVSRSASADTVYAARMEVQHAK